VIARRTVLTGGAGLLLTGCDRVLQVPKAKEVLFAGERFQRGLHRAITDRGALAPEYRLDQRSPAFRTNGTRDPGTPEYAALAEGGFADWRLQVDGLVDRPLSLSLAQLQSMPVRNQVTRHDCVEGWSAIGAWSGPPLRLLLDQAGMRRSARYVVFRCADRYGATPYYESIDLVDALHPQTIVALRLNGQPLDVGHGAPARLRVERQLGYKHAKYLMQVTAVDRLDRIGRGKGGYWEDYHDYDWYAGI
jgi:DMSO/TMAO reductase YedYZ molybdopterin-dependent catalytic subunit